MPSKYLLPLAVLLALVSLAGYVFLQSGGPPTVSARPENYLSFRDVVISQLSDNLKLWELEVKQAQLSDDRDKIILKDSAGNIFDRARRPLFRIQAPLASIHQAKNEVIFENLRGRELGSSGGLLETMTLDNLLVSSGGRQISGTGHIVLTGKKLKILASRLTADATLRKITLTDEPVVIYSSPTLKNKIIITAPELTADQTLQLVRARGPVKVEWGTARMMARAADFRAAPNIFTLFGPVIINYNNLTARGDKMTFDPETELLVLAGQPVEAERNGELLKGAEVRLSLKDSRLVLKKIGQLEINLEGR